MTLALSGLALFSRRGDRDVQSCSAWQDGVVQEGHMGNDAMRGAGARRVKGSGGRWEYMFKTYMFLLIVGPGIFVG